jgi:hypothetical protein
MGQAANNRNRNASLDDKKMRAAGRQKEQGLQAGAVNDAYSEDFAKGKTAGAFGKDAIANRESGNRTREGGGGGGGASTPAGAAPITTNRSSRPARKR